MVPITIMVSTITARVTAGHISTQATLTATITTATTIMTIIEMPTTVISDRELSTKFAAGRPQAIISL
jgi:hypothetical protein